MLTIILLRIGWLGIVVLIVFCIAIICMALFIWAQKISMNDAKEDKYGGYIPKEKDNAILDWWYQHEYNRTHTFN